MLHNISLRACGCQTIYMHQMVLWRDKPLRRTLVVLSSSQQSNSTHIENERWGLRLRRLKSDPPVVQRRHLSKGTIAYYLSPENPPVGLAQQVLENVHTWTGLPWWATIFLTTCTLRAVVTLPLGIYTIHIATRLEGVRRDLGLKARQLKGEIVAASKQYQWSDRTAHRQFKVNMKRLEKQAYIDKNCHPMKIVTMALFQIPIWVSLSLALRNLSGALPIKGTENVVLAPMLATEGLLWFPNLLVPDTTFLLPLTVGILNLLIVEVNSVIPGTPSRFHKGLTFFLRGVSVCMIPIAASVPSCMAFYWACSSFCGVTQNIVLKLPSVRRACGVPKMPSESETPIQDVIQHLRNRYTLRRFREPPGKKE